MLGWVRIETQCCSLIGRELHQLSVTDECRIRSGDGRLDSPHVRKSRHLGLAVRHGVPSFISMKPWIPARTLAHLQIAAAAHLGGETRSGLEYWPARKERFVRLQGTA